VTISFGSFELDLDRFELRRDGASIALEPQVFKVLAYLATHRDRVISKEELLDNVWGDRFVSESAITTRIKEARRAIGDDGLHQRSIKTVHGRGYRFVAAARDAGTATPEAASETTAAAVGMASSDLPPADGWPMIGRASELEEVAALLRSGAAGGVLLTGGAGVGKTRLADECLRLAVGAGLPTARASGHRAAREIPFAALAHLLPVDIATASAGEGELDRATVFHRARSALRERGGDQRLLLHIDDADQLDELSRGLVASLVESRDLFTILTVRSGPGIGAFDDLVKDGSLRRLTIERLPSAMIETLLHRILGGPMIADSVRAIIDASEGNPGVIRQLVETALERDVLVAHDGVWLLAGPLQPAASLEHLVEERLGGLSDAHRHVAELLAVAGQISLGAIEPLAGHELLEDLEQRGVLSVRPSGRRTDIALAHPLFAELLLTRLTPLRGRRLRRELADALEAVGARRRDDRVRVVAWRIEGGGDVDPGLVVGAARLALLEGAYAIAERLIRRAADDGAGGAATELLGELHFRRNDPAAVETTLAGIDLADLDEEARVRVVRRRAGNLFYGLTDPEGALRVIDDAAPSITDPEGQRSIEAQRAIVLSMWGEVGQALACSARLDRGGSRTIRFEVIRARSLALAAAGRGEDALQLIVEGTDLHEAFDATLDRPGRTILVFNELLALTELGRLDEARELARRSEQESPEGARRAWIAFAAPRIELLAGNPHAAVEAGADFARETRARGFFGAERWVLALVGMGRLLGGDIDQGGRDLDRVAALWPQDTGLFRSDRDRALGWVAAYRGDLSGGVEILRAGAENARRRDAFALEAMLLHDAVRFGAAGPVAARLAELATIVQGGMIVARVDHAVGIADSDAARLASAVDGFEACGASLLAAEASHALATLVGSRGDRPAAATAERRSEQLLASADGTVTTPGLPGWQRAP
jgi:DNA-binding winged helix-turn-helix (wHTH) protein